MIVELCNLQNYRSVRPLTQEVFLKELNSHRIQNLMKHRSWFVDAFRSFEFEDVSHTNIETVAFRLLRCWFDTPESTTLMGEVELLDTIEGENVKPYLDKVRFVMKGILTETDLILIGFSYKMTYTYEYTTYK